MNEFYRAKFNFSPTSGNFHTYCHSIPHSDSYPLADSNAHAYENPYSF